MEDATYDDYEVGLTGTMDIQVSDPIDRRVTGGAVVHIDGVDLDKLTTARLVVDLIRRAGLTPDNLEAAAVHLGGPEAAAYVNAARDPDQGTPAADVKAVIREWKRAERARDALIVVVERLTRGSE